MNESGKDCFVNVTGKKQTLDNLHVNLPVVSHVLIAGGQSQKKGGSPDIVQHQSIKYVKNDSCISLKFCHKCPSCCSRSACRGQITPVLGN